MGIEFLYPQFFYAFLFLFIPIIIHILNLQRTKKVNFTNLAFLENVKDSTNTKFKIRRWLTLFARILFLSFLILAFCFPFIKSESNSKRGAFKTYLIDNSFSMENELGGQRLFDLVIKNISEHLPENNNELKIFSNNTEHENIFPLTISESQDYLLDLDLTSNGMDLIKMLKRNESLLNNQRIDSGDVYVYSDFQKSNGGPTNSELNHFSQNVQLIKVTGERVQNVYVDSVWFSNYYLGTNDQLELNVRFQRSGDGSELKFQSKLFIDDNQVGNLNRDFKNKNEFIGKFNFVIKKPGRVKARISLNDHGLEFDNEFYFTFNVGRSINIAVINEDGDTASSVSKVYSNESLFTTNISSINVLNYNAIENSDLIVLENFSGNNDAFNTELERLLNKGKSIVLIPGQDNDGLKKFCEGLKIGLGVQDSGDTAFLSVNKPEKNNEFFRNVFLNVDGSISLPEAKPRLTVKQQVNRILDYKNGVPFLFELKRGKGKIFVINATLKNDFTNLHHHSLFVPIAYRAAMTLCEANEPLMYRLGGVIGVRDTSGIKELNYIIKNKENEIVPDQTLVNGKVLIQLPVGDLPAGYYQIMKDGNLINTIAVNYVEHESIMDYWSLDELKDWCKNKSNFSVKELSKDEILQKGGALSEATKTSLWKYCLILALVFLLIEIGLIRFWK